MKIEIYKCDHCNKEIDQNQMIELSSDNNSIGYFNANSKKGELIELANYSNLHFCGKDHFINYFFNKEQES